MTAEPPSPGAVAPAGWPRGWPLLLFAAAAALSLGVLRGALHGPFLSDDIGYIVHNPYVAKLDLEHVRAIFDPGSPAQTYGVGNYSPVHVLFHVLEWQIFADRVLGYHLVNVLVHALACVLLVALWLRSGIPAPAGLLAAALFAVHPANVEAVAWISQLKSSAGLCWALGALLALRRHPGWATGLFAMGLLTKASAAFALPTAAAFAWTHRARAAEWRWLGVWTLLFAVYAAIEFGQFAHWGWSDAPAMADPAVRLRSIAAGGARYLVMAVSSYGVSAWHEPAPVLSWLDPWWLAALPLGALLAWRTLHTLARRSDEGAWWLSAAVSFGPVSQIFPFRHPLADHYLYFILPGLLGGALLWGRPWRLRAPPWARSAALAGAGLWILGFALHAQARAELWDSEIALSLDAARHYPDGRTAHLLRARAAARAGDPQRAVAELRGAHERGFHQFMGVRQDPGLSRLQGVPEFDELVRDMAGHWIEVARERSVRGQAELRMLGLAHFVRGELDDAVAVYRRAAAAEGPLAATVRDELAALEARRERAARDEG